MVDIIAQEEADLPINSALAPGAEVPGVKAYRTTPGKAIQPIKASIEIAGVKKATKIDPTSKEVIFQLKLPKGKTKLTTLFTTESGTAYGAYFVYVTKK